jgi:hypothetical protein
VVGEEPVETEPTTPREARTTRGPADGHLEHARAFIANAAVPRPKIMRGGAPTPTVALNLETGKNQAAVVGSEITSFVTGVSAERREGIINSSLLAQLVAKKKVPDPTKIYEWYDAYFDVLTNIGWVVQDKSFAEYDENSENFEAHEAILAVATTLLGAGTTALAVVASALEALKKMDRDGPWITIFSRESQHARSARFQISLAEQDANGRFLVSLMAFGLEARSSITQVLFFKVRDNGATLRHYAGKVTINTLVLDGVRDAIKAKLSGQASDYVKALPDLAIT